MARYFKQVSGKLILAVLLSVLALNTAGRPTTDEAIAAIIAAADKRDATAPAILSGLTSNQLAVQKQAILALGRIGAPKSVKSLAAFLYSPQPEIRSLTAYALGITGAQAALPALINRLKTEQAAPVISELLPAMGLIGPAEESPDIIEIPFISP